MQNLTLNTAVSAPKHWHYLTRVSSGYWRHPQNKLRKIQELEERLSIMESFDTL